MFQQMGPDRPVFPEHLPLSQIQKGLKFGRFLQGTFQASRDNYLEANVGVQDREDFVNYLPLTLL